MRRLEAHRSTADRTADAPLGERLLDRAMEILERDGAAAITLRALAGAAGVSHMAPYRHFADKEALLAALGASGFVALGQAMQQAGASQGQAAAPDERARLALLGFGLAYLDFARSRPQLYRLMFGPALADKPQHEEYRTAAQATFTGFSHAVAAVVGDRGQSAAEETKALAVATWALVHGLALLLIDGRLAAAGDKAAEDALVRQVLLVHGRTFPSRESDETGSPSDPPRT